MLALRLLHRGEEATLLTGLEPSTYINLRTDLKIGHYITYARGRRKAAPTGRGGDNLMHDVSPVKLNLFNLRMLLMALLFVFAYSISVPCFAGEKLNATQLIELAKSKSPGLHDAITASFEAKDLTEGKAWSGRGPDFFFATEADSEPALFIDEKAGPKMQELTGSNLWYAVAHIEPLGKAHSFYYMVDGKKFGGSLDVPAFGPLSYLQPGVPTGKLSDKIVHSSKIYDGMKS